MTPGPESMRLAGQRCLVTGAASGIGRAVALRLAQEGATLALADRDPAGLRDVAKQTGATAHVFDAAQPGDSARMLQDAVAATGGLDTVLAIAGIYHRAHAATAARADWDQVMAINLSAVFELAQAAHPVLARSKGAMVTTASTAAIKGIAYAPAYAAAKAGVIGLTKSLAAEWAHQGIRVNAVAPGRVQTKIGAGLPSLDDTKAELATHPAKLAGQEDGVPPEDVAGLYAFLCSRDAHFVTGHVLVADGGNMVG